MAVEMAMAGLSTASSPPIRLPGRSSNSKGQGQDLKVKVIFVPSGVIFQIGSTSQMSLLSRWKVFMSHDKGCALARKGI